MKLVCPTEGCDSNNSCLAYFNVTVTVGAERDLTEDIRRIPPEHFECGHCGAKADTPERLP